MITDLCDHRARADPLIGGFRGIIVVDGTSGGIIAIESFLGCAIGGFADGLIDLTIGNGSVSEIAIQMENESLYKNNANESLCELLGYK